MLTGLGFTEHRTTSTWTYLGKAAAKDDDFDRIFNEIFGGMENFGRRR
jgi:hypothetical protein